MFKKVLDYTGEYKKYTYAAIVVMLFGVAFNILPFYFAYQLILPIFGYGEMSVSGIIWRILGIAVTGCGYALFFVGGLALSHTSAYHTLENIRNSLKNKMEKQPLGIIQEKGIGAIKKLFVDDIEMIEILLAHAIPEGLGNLAIPVFVLIAMFFVDWKLALLSILALPLGIFAMSMMMKAGMAKMNAYYGSAKKMNNTIIEYINGMEVVKVFNKDGESYKNLEKDVTDYRDFTLDWYKECWPWMAVYNSLLPCIALFTLPVGSYLVLKGYSTLPDLLLVVMLSFSMGAPLLRALGFAGKIPALGYKIDAVENMMGAETLIQSNRGFEGKNHEITFEDVTFAYKEDEVLHDISFSIKDGSLTAFVGESGSGKSTMAKLLVHFYDVKSGSIKIGGQKLTDMSIEALNNEISFVSQEQFLFNISLLENIRIGKPDASDEEVMEAAKKAQCFEFFDRLEKGIHTMAGDGGKQLSGGERQRISLARAILKDAPIIVLDEATAFMDPENEEKMNAAIAEVIRDKTVIVIAHRLKTIMNADKICVFDQGNLIAEGTHEELLNSCPKYATLWNASEESANWKVTTILESERQILSSTMDSDFASKNKEVL